MQWKDIVKHIKEWGSIESAIAVCDVSDSMSGSMLSNGTYPMGGSIGLVLLLADIVEPPFEAAL